ncbi:hypothetical protein [Gloeocapsopsis crepidinum]|nr:hypothetical protein [Gloeocapsopsis crepidinum]
MNSQKFDRRLDEAIAHPQIFHHETLAIAIISTSCGLFADHLTQF